MKDAKPFARHRGLFVPYAGNSYCPGPEDYTQCVLRVFSLPCCFFSFYHVLFSFAVNLFLFALGSVSFVLKVVGHRPYFKGKRLALHLVMLALICP